MIRRIPAALPLADRGWWRSFRGNVCSWAITPEMRASGHRVTLGEPGPSTSGLGESGLAAPGPGLLSPRSAAWRSCRTVKAEITGCIGSKSCGSWPPTDDLRSRPVWCGAEASSAQPSAWLRVERASGLRDPAGGRRPRTAATNAHRGARPHRTRYRGRGRPGRCPRNGQRIDSSAMVCIGRAMADRRRPWRWGLGSHRNTHRAGEGSAGDRGGVGRTAQDPPRSRSERRNHRSFLGQPVKGQITLRNTVTGRRTATVDVRSPG